MRLFCFTRNSLSLLITLVLCFTLHIPGTISLAGSPPPQKEKPQYVIRVGTMMPAGVSHMKYFEKEMRELEALTNHRLKFELYTGGVLGDQPAMVKMVRNGQLEIALLSPSGLAEAVPETLILSLAFLFQDEFEMDFILEKYEPLFAQYAHERGIEILGISPGGCSPIFSTVPISGDIREKKVMTVKKWTLSSGENRIPLSFSEVEPALNSGKVEVVFGPPAVVVTMGWYPYIRYAYMTCAASLVGALICNSEIYQDLPKEIRSVIAEFMQKQRKTNLKRIRRDNEIAMLGLMKRGVKIIQIPPEKMERQREATKPSWYSGVGKFYSRELLNNVLRDLEAYRAANSFK